MEALEEDTVHPFKAQRTLLCHHKAAQVFHVVSGSADLTPTGELD